MEPLLILIDGYNVIRKTPALLAAERVSLAAGREALLERVAAAFRHTPHRAVVVFDGDGAAESVAALRGRARGQVMYTARGESADAVLTRLAHEATVRGERAVVVSEDLEVRLGALSAGAGAFRPPELGARLNQASRDVAQRGRHRAAVRAQWQADEDDAPGGTRKKGNGRRTPRKHRPGGGSSPF